MIKAEDLLSNELRIVSGNKSWDTALFTLIVEIAI